jgi:hypothetical protein
MAVAIAVVISFFAVATLPALLISVFTPGASARTVAYCASALASTPTPAPATTDQIARAVVVRAAAESLTPEPKAQLAALTAAFAASGLTDSVQGGPVTGDDDPVGVYRRTVRGGWGTAAQLADLTEATVLILSGVSTARPGIMTDPSWIDEPTGQWLATIGITSTPDEAARAEASAKSLLLQLDPSLSESTLITGQACGIAAITGDSRQLAQALVVDMQQDRLVGSSELDQIRDIAEGLAVPDCGVDVRILQVLIIALKTFHTVAVSDINRKCIGSLEGAGTSSAHYIDGGGHAVDIYALDGQPLTGDDENSRKLLSTIDPYMPAGARTGQSECRSDDPLTLPHLSQFEDTCTHVHIDVAFADGGLTGTPPSGSLANP